MYKRDYDDGNMHMVLILKLVIIYFQFNNDFVEFNKLLEYSISDLVRTSGHFNDYKKLCSKYNKYDSDFANIIRDFKYSIGNWIYKYLARFKRSDDGNKKRGVIDHALLNKLGDFLFAKQDWEKSSTDKTYLKNKEAWELLVHYAIKVDGQSKTDDGLQQHPLRKDPIIREIMLLLY